MAEFNFYLYVNDYPVKIQVERVLLKYSNWDLCFQLTMNLNFRLKSYIKFLASIEAPRIKQSLQTTF